MATNLFCICDPSDIYPTAGTKATGLPKATNTVATGAGYLDSSVDGVLADYWGGTGNIINRTLVSNIQTTSIQSYYFGRFSTRPLAAQTIPAQSWNYNFIVGEANASVNTKFMPVMYVWRPSNNTVVGYIFDDSTASLGTEWGTTPGALTQNMSGASVTTQDGDILVIECWAGGQSATATNQTQTWRMTANTSKLVSPYTLVYQSQSILFFQATTPLKVPTAGTKATNLPKAQHTNWSGYATEGLLTESLIQAPVGRSLNTIATTSQQSTYWGRHSSLPLGSQVIPAQKWGWEVSCGTGNDLGNIFHWPVLYIWRPSTNSVVSFILDANANYGIEWRNGVDPLLNQQFMGASATVQNGDILVCEVWGVATQGAAAQYTPNVWTTAQNSALVSPLHKLVYASAKRRACVFS